MIIIASINRVNPVKRPLAILSLVLGTSHDLSLQRISLIE